MKQLLSTLCMLWLFHSSIAQSAEMADTMRANGKIYVVVGVVALIFAVLFVYMIWIDKRLSRLEKERKQ